ncbi:MAG: hypothetical protein AAGF82_19080 [Pseudomonadota bacterium]
MFSALVSIALAAILVFDWIFEWGGAVTEIGIAEGCEVPPYLLPTIFLTVCIVCFFVAFKRHRGV